MSCKHQNFNANVKVVHMEDIGKFTADIRINCVACGQPFVFLGLPMGFSMAGAAVSVDGQEARLAIEPASRKSFAIGLDGKKLN